MRLRECFPQLRGHIYRQCYNVSIKSKERKKKRNATYSLASLDMRKKDFRWFLKEANAVMRIYFYWEDKHICGLSGKNVGGLKMEGYKVMEVKIAIRG